MSAAVKAGCLGHGVLNPRGLMDSGEGRKEKAMNGGREEMPHVQGDGRIVTVKGQIRDFASLSLSESHPRLF